MNNLIMQIPLKPLSVNSKFTLHYKSRRIIKSNSANRFEKEVASHLLRYSKNMAEFRDSFNPKTEALTLEVVLYVPREEFFTKDNRVSSTCIDAGNALKMLEDIIYKALGINDGLNVKVSSEKRPVARDEWLTLVMITKVEKPRICALDAIAFT